MKIFENSTFIKPRRKINKHFEYNNYAPMFRRKFELKNTDNAKLYVCGLGYGYYYINGIPVSRDKFTAPVSNYTKTLWYNTYDVTELLYPGKNIITVWCGNGWYNEEMETPWGYHEAIWRDVPKFIMQLDIDGKTVIVSDDKWRCSVDGPIWFNALRCGEYFDSRKFNPLWIEYNYDDSDWEYAQVDDTPPEGVFRECLCEPILEFEHYKAKKVTKVDEKKYLFDIGQNISGYVRIKAKCRAGDILTIRYAEQIKADNSLQLNKMTDCYPQSEFQTDKLILSGKKIEWSPMFCYHGFRYMEISGLTSADDISAEGVFVHQAVEKRTEFYCSDDFLNKLFKAGEYAVYSNMFYMLTDCPTREKLGWTNDAQSSLEQILTNFKAEKLLEKWMQDIFDAMREDGSMPGIIPTAGWGYHWGNGPVSDGILFEIPYKIYLHTGNVELLKQALPYFEKYLDYLDSHTSMTGFVEFGLYDWAYPGFDCEIDKANVPVEFINALFIYHFCEISIIAAELSGENCKKFLQKKENTKNLIKKTYIDKRGNCIINKQTAVAMLIYYGIYDEFEPLRKQLKALIEEHNFHHDCGMVGLRRLYIALNRCGLQEYAYKIITAKGYPSYREWFDNGATTLWETWDCNKHADSKNHHMYSDFMSWIIKTILGINIFADKEGEHHIDIKPYFLKDLQYARGKYDSVFGKFDISWERINNEVFLKISITKEGNIYCNGKKLERGTYEFKIEQ